MDAASQAPEVEGAVSEEEDVAVLRAMARGRPGAVGGDAAPGGGRIVNPCSTLWADFAPQLPRKARKQIRDRWADYLNLAIRHFLFSCKDNLRLWENHRELGVEISA